MKFLKIIQFVILFLFCLIPNWTFSSLTVEIFATVPGCGDSLITSGEQCDGSNLGGSSCSSLGFSSGILSCSSACTFNTSQCLLASQNPPSSGGGGGGGGPISPIVPNVPNTNVVFSGRAYPLSRVSILKDGQLVVTTIAGPDSNFTATVSGLSSGNYTFAVYGEDKNNIRSSLFSFPILITSGVTTKIGGIFIAPTISVDKSEVRRGDNIAIFGQSVPNSEVTISVNSPQEFIIKRQADKEGVYLLNFDTLVLDKGEHEIKSKSSIEGDLSSLSNIVNFKVGDKNVTKEKIQSTEKGDVNGDVRVNLVDFSIVAFWYRKQNPPKNVDLNSDGKVDLIDFSIMAFNWTG